jgi:SNF2 family DNA or RNA helicase
MHPAPHVQERGELRPYKIDSLNWLCFHCQARVNSILADELGLGKIMMGIVMLKGIIKRVGAARYPSELGARVPGVD